MAFIMLYPRGSLFAGSYQREDCFAFTQSQLPSKDIAMGPGLITGTAVAIAKVALAATVTTTSGLANPVNVAPDPPYVQFVAGNPIRTIVTVNSNEADVIAADVIAADEEDVPRTIEKLLELCSGPFAPLYPEICGTVENGSAVEDLGLGDAIRWLSDPISHMVTITGVGDLMSDVPSTRTHDPTWAAETIPATRGNAVLADLPEYVPEALRSVPTLAVPAASTTTRTLEVVVHEVPGTSLPLRITSGGKFNKTYNNDPTTFETRIKSSLASLDEGGRNTDTVPIGTANKHGPTIGDKPVAAGFLLEYLRGTDKSEQGPTPSVTSATMIICYTTTPTTDVHTVYTFTVSPRPSKSRNSPDVPPITADNPSTTTV